MEDAFGATFAEFADGVLQRARSRLTGRSDDVEGVGEAADGRVRAAVTAGGRLRELTVDPHMIRSRDPELLVEEIKAAVNRAVDDLQARLRDASSVTSELDAVVAGLDRVFDQLSTDIARERSRRG